MTFSRARPGKVSVNLTAIQSIFEPGGGVHNTGTRFGREMVGVASRSVKTVTGQLSRSYRNATSPNYLGLFVTLYTTAEHGKWYEDGTASEGLGYIRPRKGKTMKIPMGRAGFAPRTPQQSTTGFVHAARVRGQRPKHTMENAMRIVLKMNGLM